MRPGRRVNSTPRRPIVLSPFPSPVLPPSRFLQPPSIHHHLAGEGRGMLRAVRYLLGSPGESGFGSRSTAEEVTPDLGTTTTAIITGATSGIGAETARVLAKRGARVVIPARSPKAAEDVRARIVAECPAADVLVLPLDLSSLASVRAFADRFLDLGLPLHLLINNAGKFSHGQMALSEDGVEMTFATNYLGHFLLTKLLAGRMAETAEATGVQGRIVNVSSSVHGWFAGDWAEYLDLVTRRKIPYDATQAYAVSKLANVLHTRELAARLQEMGANVTVNCVHPGIVRTRLNRDRDGVLTDLVFLLLSKLLKTIPQAAATTCYVAAHPRVAGVSGRYFADCNEAMPSPAATDRHEAARLWRLSEAIIDGCTSTSTGGQPQQDCTATTAPSFRFLPAQTQTQQSQMEVVSSSPRRRAC